MRKLARPLKLCADRSDAGGEPSRDCASSEADGAVDGCRDTARPDDTWLDDTSWFDGAWLDDAWLDDAWLDDAWLDDAWLDGPWLDTAWPDPAPVEHVRSSSSCGQLDTGEPLPVRPEMSLGRTVPGRRSPSAPTAWMMRRPHSPSSPSGKASSAALRLPQPSARDMSRRSIG
jgi:hypothetical protein